jgi:hypothetical protein
MVVRHVDTELVAAAPPARMAPEATREALAVRVTPRDTGVDEAAVVAPDRVDTRTAAWDNSAQLRVVCEPVQPAVLEPMTLRGRRYSSPGPAAGSG